MITVEQQRQMTTLTAGNIHSVGVENCPDGGDDLDLVVEKLFSDHDLVRQLHLSSVNSINWCRVMVQSVHYIYAYLKGCGTIGKPVVVSVPSGAFGNLFAGYLARAMGVPIHTFVCANNSNATLHRAFSTGVFQKQDLIRTVSSAIDIVVPYNFWRFLYFQSGCDGQQLSRWMDRFRQDGRFRLDEGTAARIREGYLSCSVSDTSTLECIKDTWQSQGYLLDPHGAVAVDAVRQLRGQLPEDAGRICLATAHPAKFPKVIQAALGSGIDLPDPAYHRSLADAAGRPERMQTCSKDDLETLLIESMRSSISRRK
jgi:threonine synthase